MTTIAHGTVLTTGELELVVLANLLLTAILLAMVAALLIMKRRDRKLSEDFLKQARLYARLFATAGKSTEAAACRIEKTANARPPEPPQITPCAMCVNYDPVRMESCRNFDVRKPAAELLGGG